MYEMFTIYFLSVSLRKSILITQYSEFFHFKIYFLQFAHPIAWFGITSMFIFSFIKFLENDVVLLFEWWLWEVWCQSISFALVNYFYLFETQGTEDFPFNLLSLIVVLRHLDHSIFQVPGGLFQFTDSVILFLESFLGL